MSVENTIISIARQTIESEALAISNLKQLVDNEFSEATKCILNSAGRVIVTGVGKSAHVGNKIVATLNSTGTPAIFMHAADAIHGDLGNILKDDVVICVSKSGNTPEVKSLIPCIKNFGNKIVAITQSKTSFLGEQADYMLNSFVEKEACPNNLAPTTSTTAQMVIGDALAICLLHLRGFSSADFAKFHPGGILGKRLYLRVLHLTDKNKKPSVSLDATVHEVIVEMTEKRLGATAVVDGSKLLGIITDGDLRRMLTRANNFTDLKAKEIMSANPKTIAHDAMAIDAMDLMENNSITQLIALNEGNYEGMLHIHELIREGIR